MSHTRSVVVVGNQTKIIAKTTCSEINSHVLLLSLLKLKFDLGHVDPCTVLLWAILILYGSVNANRNSYIITILWRHVAYIPLLHCTMPPSVCPITANLQVPSTPSEWRRSCEPDVMLIVNRDELACLCLLFVGAIRKFIQSDRKYNCIYWIYVAASAKFYYESLVLTKASSLIRALCQILRSCGSLVPALPSSPSARRFVPSRPLAHQTEGLKQNRTPPSCGPDQRCIISTITPNYVS